MGENSDSLAITHLRFEKWNLEGIDDSPFSLLLTPLKMKILLSWQMKAVVTNCPSLFCSSERVCDSPFKF